jgi:glycosyltransferase involved in cell wall biosynthesis
MRNSRVAGVRAGFEMLIEGFSLYGLPYKIVDMAEGGNVSKAGTFSVQRLLASLLIALKAWILLPKVRNVYMTIASSRLGFFRDALVIWPSKLLRKKIILHLKGGGYDEFYNAQPLWLQRFVRATLCQANVIVVLGELLREQFCFLSDSNVRIKVVPNGLPFELEQEVNIQKKPSIESTVRILYLSNMIRSKGYLDVLAACRILHHEYNVPIKCDFCGDFLVTAEDEDAITPQIAKANFLALIKAWDLQDVVTYHGIVLGHEKQLLLLNSHVFVLPTTYRGEGQPISIIEALAFGLPVISTNFRGIPEQVIDGFNGYLVEPASPEQIALAVRKMWQTPALYKELSDNALQHFSRNFTRDVHLARLISSILDN